MDDGGWNVAARNDLPQSDASRAKRRRISEAAPVLAGVLFA